MYCNDCKRFFDEPAIERDGPSPKGISLTAGYYEWSVCPFCGSGDIEESAKCKSCDEDVQKYEMLCDDCKKEVADSLNALQESLRVDRSDFEDIIADHFGW